MRRRVSRDPVRLRELVEYIESSARDNARTTPPYDADETLEGIRNTLASASMLIDDMQTDSGMRMYGFSRRGLSRRETRAIERYFDYRYGRILRAHSPKKKAAKRRR